MPLTTADHAAAALGLPVGRAFASGRGFVPFCKTAAHARLSAFAEAYAPEPPAAPADAAGSLADGSANGPADDMGDDAAPTTPATWGAIAIGSLVLASEGEHMGWFEAVVTEDRGEDLFVLRWRDWPDVAPFPRRRDHLALLPAATGEAVDAGAAVDAANAADTAEAAAAQA